MRHGKGGGGFPFTKDFDGDGNELRSMGRARSGFRSYRASMQTWIDVCCVVILCTIIF